MRAAGCGPLRRGRAPVARCVRVGRGKTPDGRIFTHRPVREVAAPFGHMHRVHGLRGYSARNRMFRSTQPAEVGMPLTVPFSVYCHIT